MSVEQVEAKQCKFFKLSRCRKGDTCKFSHAEIGGEERIGRIRPCRFFKRGKCRNGLECKFLHDQEKSKDNPIASEEWSITQQKQLDNALATVPTNMEKVERWKKIAEQVDEKDVNACVKRFKVLCDLVSRAPTPQEPAFKIELEPLPNGTQIKLAGLFIYAIDTFHLKELNLQIACTKCPYQADLTLTLTDSSCRKWCPRCSQLHSIEMHPVLVHEANDVLACIDVTNCAIIDVLPSSMLGICSTCQKEKVFEDCVAGKRKEVGCFHCHAKLVIEVKAYEIVGNVERDIATGSDKKIRDRRRDEGIIEGQPLPKTGTCRHYAKSYRWFRFQCCGKAFACDICHDGSDCPKAGEGIFASRMICGYCSKEQTSSVKVCSCGNTLTAGARSSHWEGGKGCRDSRLMAATEKKKHRGKKKTFSKKASRVGLEGKLRRERHVVEST